MFRAVLYSDPIIVKRDFCTYSILLGSQIRIKRNKNENKKEEKIESDDDNNDRNPVP